MLTRKRTVAALTLWIVIALIAASNIAAAEDSIQIDSTHLHVYRDGLTHVTQSITLDELTASASLELLTDSVENVVALDSNQLPVDFTVEGSTMTIISLGEKQVSLQYDTVALTSKTAETWTLNTNYPYEVTVSLPTNATLLYLSQMPSAINTVEGEIGLTLPAGSWEVSYSVPLISQETNENSDNSSETTNESTVDPLIILSIVAIAAVSISAFIIVKHQKKPNIKKVLKINPQLQPDDQKIVEFLIEKDGTAFEAEIRERFPDMPRTSLWRLVRRLERLEIVEINKIGLENQVKLKK